MAEIGRGVERNIALAISRLDEGWSLERLWWAKRRCFGREKARGISIGLKRIAESLEGANALLHAVVGGNPRRSGLCRQACWLGRRWHSEACLRGRRRMHHLGGRGEQVRSTKTCKLGSWHRVSGCTCGKGNGWSNMRERKQLRVEGGHKGPLGGPWLILG